MPTSPNPASASSSVPAPDTAPAGQAALLELLAQNARLTDTLQQRALVIEKAEEDRRTVLDAIPSLVGYWDCDLFNRVANRAYHEWFGLAPGQLPGRSLSDLLGPALYDSQRQHLQAVLQGTPQTFACDMPRPGSAALRHVLVHYIPDRQGDQVPGFYAVVHDITELRQSQLQLTQAQRENEALLATIKTHAIYSVADAAGVILDVNEGFCRISGYTREELLGRDHRLVNSGLHTRDFWAGMWRSIAAGQAWRGEICNRAKDGTLYWVDSIIAPFRGADGRPEKYISIRHDITEARAAAAALGQERERLDNILRGTNVGTWEWNVQTGMARFDEHWAQNTGRTLGELGPMGITTWRELLHPDDLPRAEAVLQRHFSGELPYYEFEGRMRHSDGHWVWVLDRGQVRTWTARGEPEWMYGTHQNIEDRRAVEERLRDSEAFLERVGAVAGVGGWEYDIDRASLSWTQQTRRISGVDERYQPTLHKALAFYTESSRPRMARAMHEAVTTGQPFDLELAYRTASGQQLWVRAVGEVQGEAYGVGHGPSRVVGAFQDITERRHTSEALLEAKAAAEAASAAKSAFLSNMSHEIRTPLNAVIGVTHLLADSPMSLDQQQLLGKAQLAGRALLAIVNDVLDLAKIEAGEIALDEGPYQPRALLAEVEALYAPQAREKGLSFDVEVAENTPPWLQCDSTRLRQVLVNLVSNALKFTSVGGVQVQVSLSEGSAERCSLLLRVRDSGIGIDPQVQDRLFSPFIQADVSTTRRYGGTGLGLSIVKRLAQIMGGEVGLSSAPGVGSEFWVSLPQGIPSADEADGAARGHGVLEVLVVDDNPVDRLGLTSQVRALGWQALPLESGAALLRELQERRTAGRPQPDALLVDWQMPGMDGLQALAGVAALAAEPVPDNSPLPARARSLPAALVVSAYERSRIASLEHAELADHILTKPVGSSALFNAVNDSLSRRQGTTEKVLQSTRLDASDTLWLADIRVLLVDDSDINLEVARRLLERRGARVRTCTSGREALACLRDTPTGFDAVLMDVQMPDMDGLTATRAIRSELGLADLPVIALTAGALVEERRRALDAGMQGFLAKPLDPGQLIRTLRCHVEGARGVALPVTGLTPAPVVLTPWPAVDGIDGEDVAHRLGHDLPLFLFMLRRLTAEFGDLAAQPGRLPPLELAAAAAADVAVKRQQLAARMHKLCGSAGTVGAHELHRAAAAAEVALRTPQAPSADAVARVAAAMAALLVPVGRLLVEHDAAAERAAAAGQASAPEAGNVNADANPPASRGAAPAPASRAQMAGLAAQLQGHDLAALDTFQHLLPALRLSLGAGTAQAMALALDTLEFEPALALLNGSPQPATTD